MCCIMVLHQGNMILYGPFVDGEAVKRYVRNNKLADQHWILLPLHDSGDTMDA